VAVSSVGSHQVVVTKLNSASRLIHSAEAPENLERPGKVDQVRPDEGSSLVAAARHMVIVRTFRVDRQAMVGAVLKGGDGVKR
jgi:hypothetical protein